MALQFWFEFASTYSYPAAMRVESACQAAGVELEYQPFLLGPIFAEQGWSDSPFNLYPAKGRYMWRDLERLAERASLRFQRPSAFPRSGLLAARIACAAKGEDWLGGFVRSVYAANFGEDRDVSTAEVLAEVLHGVGADAEEWLGRAVTPENKQRLRDQTSRAAELGVFGAPTFVVGTELFWGGDRLEQALEYVGRD